MTKLDPIIAVTDVEASSKWYQSVFGCKSIHGGDEFDILIVEDDEVILCLHKWEAHGHPSMQNSKITPGNGLILYFRIDNLEEVRQNLNEMDYDLETDIQLSPNSRKREFSVIDPDGYYLTISEFHKYQG